MTPLSKTHRKGVHSSVEFNSFGRFWNALSVSDANVIAWPKRETRKLAVAAAFVVVFTFVKLQNKRSYLSPLSARRR